jgi:hypothetical protein
LQKSHYKDSKTGETDVPPVAAWLRPAPETQTSSNRSPVELR